MAMSGIARRRFLTGAAALVGGATVVACAAPERESRVQSFVHSPEQTLPGQELWFATACAHSTCGNSVVVRTVDGRAKKVEGTKGFPVNLGKTNVRGQAGVQSLYNPDRLKTPLRRRGTRGDGQFEAIDWPQALDLLVQGFASAKNPLVVTGPVSGTRLRVLAHFLASAEGRHLVYEAQDTATLREAARLVFGYTRLPHFDIANAGAVLSFGADFLGTWLSPVHYSTAYGKFREEPNRGRLIQIEPHMSLTGANADRWVYVNPGQEGALALSIAQVIAAENLTGDDRWFDPVNAVGGLDALNAYAPELTEARTGVAPDSVREIAREFASHPPALAIAGGPALAQTNGLDNAAAALLLNRIVGSTGVAGGVQPNPAAAAAVPAPAAGTPFAQWGALATGLLDGSETVDAAFFYDVDPVYGLPASTRFADALGEMSFVVGMGTFLNETLARADLVLPATHPFEEWGDFVADPAPNMEVVGYQQPIVTSWTSARSFGDVLLALTSELAPDAPPPWTTMRDAVRDGAQALIGAEGFDRGWIELLRTGGRWQDGEGREAQSNQPDWHIGLLAEPVFAGNPTEFDLHLIPFENVAFGAGNESVNPWLQATPDPLTTVTWTTWAELNPATALRLGVKRNDVVHIDTPSGTLRARVYEAPVVPPNVVAVPIGQGRDFGSRWNVDRGANVMQTLDAQAVAGSGALAWGATRAECGRPANTTDCPPLKSSKIRATTGRRLQCELPVASGTETAELPVVAAAATLPTDDPHPETDGHRWGMVIDADKCTGCQACVVACQSENNVALNEEQRVIERRAKTWIRIERYWEGEWPNAKARFIPVLCQHCGNAPCETVCPVWATYHNPDGLNVQVYNRCIGTRFCANACPYSVRYFNFWEPEWPSPMDRQLNPDVTVRTKGIVEKCTFCVHRINRTKREADRDGRPVADGEVEPACVQSCPTTALVFGDLNDPDSHVSELSHSKRAYSLLDSLGTAPAITYLKKVDPSYVGEDEEGGH